MNSLAKIFAIALPVTLITGCGDRTDYTLSPPQNARWVTVDFKLPEGVTLLPMELLYRSDQDQCLATRYNSSNEPYTVQGYNGVDKVFSLNKSSGTWRSRVAINGGGSCNWQLNSIKVSFKLLDSLPIAQGKNIIATNYIFDIGDYGFTDGYGTGKAKKISGNLRLESVFFPQIFINNITKKTTLKLFGGNAENEKWVRRYKLNDTNIITIIPKVNIKSVVLLESPLSRPGKITITYPDGAKEQTNDIYPDYEKLLSMK